MGGGGGPGVVGVKVVGDPGVVGSRGSRGGRAQEGGWVGSRVMGVKGIWVGRIGVKGYEVKVVEI